MNQLKYHVKVTHQTIYDGIKGDPTACPIAEAIKNLGIPYPEVEEHKVKYGEWSPDDGTLTYYVAKLPEAAEQFIQDFDHDNPTTPFEFDIEFVEQENFND